MQVPLADQISYYQGRRSSRLDHDRIAVLNHRGGGLRNPVLLVRTIAVTLHDAAVKGRHRAAVGTYQETLLFQGGEVTADGHLRHSEFVADVGHRNRRVFRQKRQNLPFPFR